MYRAPRCTERQDSLGEGHSFLPWKTSGAVKWQDKGRVETVVELRAADPNTSPKFSIGSNGVAVIFFYRTRIYTVAARLREGHIKSWERDGARRKPPSRF
jgi:hypothetical protein